MSSSFLTIPVEFAVFQLTTVLKFKAGLDIQKN